jgi:hypothetical protein
MKKSLSLLIVLAACCLSACSSAHKAPKVAAQFNPVSSGGVTVQVAKPDPHAAIEHLISYTATLSAVEEQATTDADNQDVPAFTQDCAALKPVGATWNTTLATINANFPDALTTSGIDPSDAQLTLAELMAGCAPFMPPLPAATPGPSTTAKG